MKISRVAQAIHRRGDRFVSRILSGGEQALCPDNVALEAWIAGRFAAKEACLKALGTGWAAGVSFPQVQVLGDGTLELSGEAGRRADSLGVVRSWVALSAEGDLMAALVILHG